MMKKFFFRVCFLLLFASLLYALFLSAPFLLFFHAFQALNDSEEAFALELNPLSALIVLEESSDANAALVPNQTLTYSLPDDVLESMLSKHLNARPIPGIALKSVKVLIAPEMLSLEVSWQCEVLGYRFYENTVFSEWLLRVSGSGETRHIEVKPNDLHSNHLYSVNLAKYASDIPWLATQDGWFSLDSTSRLHIRELALQDGDVALTLGAPTGEAERSSDFSPEPAEADESQPAETLQ